jgi:hypothetical protein
MLNCVALVRVTGQSTVPDPPLTVPGSHRFSEAFHCSACPSQGAVAPTARPCSFPTTTVPGAPLTSPPNALQFAAVPSLESTLSLCPAIAGSPPEPVAAGADQVFAAVHA